MDEANVSTWYTADWELRAGGARRRSANLARAIEGGLNGCRANFADRLPNVDRELFVEVPTMALDDEALLPTNMMRHPVWPRWPTRCGPRWWSAR